MWIVIWNTGEKRFDDAYEAQQFALTIYIMKIKNAMFVYSKNLLTDRK